jgi:predicted alpha-1,2-mannosidase
MPISSNIYPTLLQNYGWKSGFSHEKEKASAGYYSVYLDLWKVKVELTSTKYVGVHRYTFDRKESPKVILFYTSSSLMEKGGVLESKINIQQSEGEITGYTHNYGSLTSGGGGNKIYYVMKMIKGSMVKHGVWNGTKISEGLSELTSRDVGCYVGVDRDIVEFAVGISFISLEQARRNLAHDMEGGKSFDDVHKESEQDWEEELSNYQVVTQYENDKIKFFTSLYHTLIVPTTFSEIGGIYLGFDKKIHRLEQGSDAFYTEMSIWDTFRTHFPYIALAKPDMMRDFARSLVSMYQQGGTLPRWPIANHDGFTMIGQHAVNVLADAWFKGIRDFNLTLAYEGMRKGALDPQSGGRSNLADYIRLGYVPYETTTAGCSETVEYAYNDWAVGNIAGVLGFTEDQKLFLNRSKNYLNVWEPNEKFFCARLRNGKFDCPIIKLNPFDTRYVEGNAWHWRWFAPHDMENLVALFGREYFVSELETFFKKSKDFPWNTLPNPYYWHGNEPDLFAVWMFNWANRSDLTQYYSRWILEERYNTSPHGLDGNDDYGTLSAWYLLASMGFYPITGSSTYVVGSPLFDKFSMRHKHGILTIIAHNNSKENVYVDRAVINGKPLGSFVDHKDLIQRNALVEFWMKK